MFAEMLTHFRAVSHSHIFAFHLPAAVKGGYPEEGFSQELKEAKC